MKFSRWLPHLVGAIAILNAPSMVSPVSNTEIERMHSVTQDLTRLRDYPLTMSPAALATWRREAAAWIDYWLSFLESIDLERMSQSRDGELSHYAKVNILSHQELTRYREMLRDNSVLRESSDLLTAYHIERACNHFSVSIVPLGMNTDRILEKYSEGARIARGGLFHTVSVVDYYSLNHGAPKW